MRDSTRAIAGCALLLAVALAASAAQAQETPPPEPATQTVTVRPGLTVAPDEPLAVWLASTIVTEDAQGAGVEVWWQDARLGWVRLSPCDGELIVCDPLYGRMEMDGLAQGDVLTLGGE